MKVKELIAELQKLEQDRNIWVFYDFPYAIMVPKFEEVEAEEANYFANNGCKPGDYVHWA